MCPLYGEVFGVNTTYLDMIRGENPSHTPVWFMRQAGRSQAKYREIKKKYTLFEITRNPELCAYVTQLPVEEYGVDAAILYKDIMSPMEAMGIHVEIQPGKGPVFETPIRSQADVDKIHDFDVTKLEHISDTIKLLTKEILQVPLIGFCGAPFTIASYLVEGGPTKNYNKTRALLVSQPEVWNALMTRLADMSIEYLSMQVEAGASALQIFDSWVGAVSAEQYKMGIFPHMKRIISAMKAKYPHIPISMHGVGTGHLMEQWGELGLDVLSLDWRCPIQSIDGLGIETAVQGNLDPAFLYASEPVLKAELDKIIEAGVRHGRHIFNLGHGVFPEADPAVLKWITDYVHERSAALWADRVDL